MFEIFMNCFYRWNKVTVTRNKHSHIIFVLICINNYMGSNIYVSHLLMKGWPNITALSAFCFIALIVTIKYFYSNRLKSFNVCSLSFLFIGIIGYSACKIFYLH